MKVVAGLVLAMSLAPLTASAQNNSIPTANGPVVFTPFQHATVQVEWNGRIIQVDPAQGDLSKAKPGDLVLVTDIHGDHLNSEMLAKVRKSGAPVVMPEAVRAQEGTKIPAPVTVLANGDKKDVAGISIEAVPMYNLTRGPAPGQLFHTKGRGNGYILSLGGKRVYFAGDTECTAEMKALKNIDVAFIPMNLPYTMTPAEAADCVKTFKPAIVYPYHYQGQKPEEFRDALKGSGIDVRLLEWYPAAPAR
jgi:L-ascorbate metabolism protein UlaG (beta-lactamase superfamily)